MPELFDDVEASVDRALSVLGNHIVMATPLGLGKPSQLINAFYRRAAANPHISLEILTALSLERPTARSELEANFLRPFVERLYGDCPSLDYIKAIRSGTLPDNISVYEFYLKAGSMISVLPVQLNYISTNYTFVARDINARGVNLMVQMVARREIDGETFLSLSCNTDVTLDLMPMMRARVSEQTPALAIAQVHDKLPFMRNDAIVRADYFDHLVSNPAYNTTLFPAPNLPVSDTDYMLGLHASSMIKDGGTLQIGIGALGDAITYTTILRHNDNNAYTSMLDTAANNKSLVHSVGGIGSFKKGLYGCSEMLVNGFLHLRKAGILSRQVYGDLTLQTLLDTEQITEEVDIDTLHHLHAAGAIQSPLTEADFQWLVHWGIFRQGLSFSQHEVIVPTRNIATDLSDKKNLAALETHVLGKQLKHGKFMHGGFFLGPEDFYESLRSLSDEESNGIAMDSVRQINRLDNYALQSVQRRHARFINTGMMLTLNGAVVSDGLDNGQVISGVGGQYNFVAQAHELDDARSILCIRASRGQGRKLTSNIVYNYAHVTIPRHLRDIVITEYGVADLRGSSDAEIIKSILNIADSRFQPELLAAAINAGKVEADYRIPALHTNNTPESVGDFIRVC